MREEFKINNNYVPYYAREFERQYPQYRGYFRNREMNDQRHTEDWRDLLTRHPQVWELFRRFVVDAVSAGFQNYSAYAIMHRIRWHYDIGD